MTSSNSFGASVLSTFDVDEDAREYLSQLIDSSIAPADEIKRLVNSSILEGYDAFQDLVSRATLMQQAKPRCQHSLEGNDVLTFIWYILANELYENDSRSVAWAETDHLIALAKTLAHNSHVFPPSSQTSQAGVILVRRRQRGTRPSPHRQQSYYWDSESVNLSRPALGGPSSDDRSSQLGAGPGNRNAIRSRSNTARDLRTGQQACTIEEASEKASCGGCSHHKRKSPFVKPTSKRTNHLSSPHFAPESNDKSLLRRKVAGIVSSVPFPPLSSPQFGLIQEKMADEPFWLLIAVTFLIKTNGQAAIPVFYKVKERFPSPKHLVDPNNAEELLGMIRHLGLGMNRLKFIQKYATEYLYAPPMPGKVYRVKNYDRRDVSLGSELPESTESWNNGVKASLILSGHDDQLALEAWEIGHMTQGKYTLDSWRIFCRDKLLGRAEDWNGKGREAEFQPEWMRVMPQDKELRAFLRWMWMREGWEWDPITGERKPLGNELQVAVNEHRVAYDDNGGLRILKSPRQLPNSQALYE